MPNAIEIETVATIQWLESRSQPAPLAATRTAFGSAFSGVEVEAELRGIAGRKLDRFFEA